MQISKKSTSTVQKDSGQQLWHRESSVNYTKMVVVRYGEVNCRTKNGACVLFLSEIYLSSSHPILPPTMAFPGGGPRTYSDYGLSGAEHAGDVGIDLALHVSSNAVRSDASRTSGTPPKTHAVPGVGYLDKLWSQIDVLDDVKSMLNEIRSRGSFFDENFNSELSRLKSAQRKLLDIVSPLPLDKLKTNINDNKTSDQSERLRHFFADDESEDADPSNVLHRQQNFKEVEQYVEEIRSGLSHVATAMKKFDELARDNW